MVKEQASMSREELLEDLLDALEIYFALTERIKTGVVYLGCGDGKDVQPALDYALIREDILERILDDSRELQRL